MHWAGRVTNTDMSTPRRQSRMIFCGTTNQLHIVVLLEEIFDPPALQLFVKDWAIGSGPEVLQNCLSFVLVPFVPPLDFGFVVEYQMEDFVHQSDIRQGCVDPGPDCFTALEVWLLEIS